MRVRLRVRVIFFVFFVSEKKKIVFFVRVRVRVIFFVFFVSEKKKLCSLLGLGLYFLCSLLVKKKNCVLC